MNDLKLVLEQSLKYKGRTGQWAWVLHRIAGLGTALFLTVHILDTAALYFSLPVYRWFVELYKTPLFGLAEIGLVACVLYHALNGLRVLIVDFWPELGVYQRPMSYAVYGLFLALFVPSSAIMLWRIVEHLGGAS
jgi:succinate dehydrogenase / fumarate reductase cytochrome b subunit